ncbi:MAG: hypothetical protein K2R93_00805 [Gemmatimonadaceae bacterium]|nr:hypothetical protein [Gemmatimonadaceae bacterium]
MSAPNRKSRWARFVRRVLITGGLGATFGSPVSAQPRAEGPLVLRLPVSARILALGNAGLTSTDADVLLSNPGMLGQARGSAASLQRYGRFATGGALASVTTAGVLSVAVGVQFLDYAAPSGRYDDAVQFGATHLSDGGRMAASSSAFTLGIARTLLGWRMGGSVKYAEDRLGALHDGTVAVDLGVSKPMGPAALGVVVQNLGAGPRLGGVRGPLPTRVGVGFGGGGFPLSEQFDIGAQMAVTVEGDGFVRPAGGAELSWVPIDGVQVVLREGLRLPREPDESLVTAGLGLTVDRFSFDYALEPMRGGRPVSHRVGLRIR